MTIQEALTVAERWVALERAVRLAGLPKATCADFMYMGEVRGVYQYKHCDTRNYAMLRGDDSADDCVKALSHARSMSQKWPDRPRMTWEKGGSK